MYHLSLKIFWPKIAISGCHHLFLFQNIVASSRSMSLVFISGNHHLFLVQNIVVANQVVPRHGLMAAYHSTYNLTDLINGINKVNSMDDGTNHWQWPMINAMLCSPCCVIPLNDHTIQF